MKKLSMAFVGDMTVDRYPEIGKIHLGGASLNSAVWARRAGADDVIIAAPVGTDAYGQMYAKKLADEGISPRALTVLSGCTSTIDIYIAPGGDRRWGTWDAGVLGRYHLSRKEFEIIKQTHAALLTIYGKTSHLLEEWYRWGITVLQRPVLAVNFDDLSQLGKTVSIVEKHIAGIDIAFFGLDRNTDATLIGELECLSRKTGKLIIITLAQQGAVGFMGRKRFTAPVIPVPPENIKDTTGAGDAFLAAFLVSYVKTRGDIITSLAAGNAFGAKKIQILGSY